MIKLLLLNLLMIFVLSLTISCEEERGRRFSLENQLKNLEESLELTEEQTNKIKPILEDQREEINEFRDNFEGERFEMRDAMMEIRKKTDQKINAILSDEQKEKYQQFQEERRERRRKR